MVKMALGLSVGVTLVLSMLMIPVTLWARNTATQFLAFEVFEKHTNREIYVTDATHGISVSLTRNSARDNWSPTWSGDNKLAYVSYAPEGNSDIYVFDFTQARLLNVTNDPRAVNRQPAWSPDGTRIAFTSQEGAATSDIYVADLPSNRLVDVTNTPVNDDQPVWLSNDELIFISDMEGKTRQVYLLNLTDHRVQNISDNDGFNHFPAVAGQQRLVAYQTLRRVDRNRMSLNVWDASTNQTFQVVASNEIAGFNWSVEGELAFSFFQDGYFHVYVWDPADGAVRQLTHGAFDGSYPAWSRDGKIAFQSDYHFEPQIDVLDPLTLSIHKIYSSYRSQFPEWSR
jgi:Tol biopolymer transport system component